MAKVTIVLENHGEKYTVRDMRRRLAQVLCRLNGDQEVSFHFVATMENYNVDLYAEVAKQNGCSRQIAKARVLGKDYTFGVSESPNGDPYAEFIKRTSENPNIVVGPLARPENN